MFLIFVNELGPNYKKENIYEFIFSNNIDELWGDEWDSTPAHGNPGPPEFEHIDKVGVLAKSKIKLLNHPTITVIRFVTALFP